MMRLIKLFTFLFIALFLGVAWWFYDYAQTPLQLNKEAQRFEIAPKSSLRSIANQLVEQGVIEQVIPFIVLTRLLGKESLLQSGLFTIDNAPTPIELIDILMDGKAAQFSITFIEGHTFREMRTRFANLKEIKHTIENMSDSEVMQAINSAYAHPEGLFFPDTYRFDRGTTDIEILKRSYEAMQSKLKQAWEKRERPLPYRSSYDALIMASIIEKETGQASERPMIAGVFVNRLRKGMLLQTDPTVIYGIGETYDGNIRRKDLVTDTPYNTYTRAGLTPTPIAMPGLAAIEAALHPAKTKALFFVGKGDGTHQFSNTLAQHTNAVRKYQLKQ